MSPSTPADRNHNVHSAYGLGMRKDVWQIMRDRYGVQNVLEMYGLSEGLASLINYNRGPRGIGAVGRDGLLQRYIKRKEWATIRVDPVTEEVLRGTDGLCLLTKPNEPGELLWRVWDPSKVPGYYKDAEATQKKMLQNVTEVGDWWFRSGDLLRKTSDGYWYFVDRLGDTFRWRSENVSTMEVSSALNQYPNLKDISVYGVSVPKHEGRAGCAAIEVAEGSTFDFVGFAALAKASLPKYAVPLFLRVTPQMPKTENNKLMKGTLKKEGANPHHIGPPDKMLWLKGGWQGGHSYVEFTKEDWDDLEAGKISL
ncbi:putative NRPS-like protein biosynthetic cluster [Exophiala oligosperma]